MAMNKYILENEVHGRPGEKLQFIVCVREKSGLLNFLSFRALLDEILLKNRKMIVSKLENNQDVTLSDVRFIDRNFIADVEIKALNRNDLIITILNKRSEIIEGQMIVFKDLFLGEIPPGDD